MISNKLTVKRALEALTKQGYTLAVGDWEGVLQKRTANPHLILDALDSVEESYLRVWHGSTKGEGHKGYLYFSGLEVFDYTDNQTIEGINNLFC